LLWEDLKQLTKEVVAAMNLTDDLRSKTGGLEYRMADLDEIVIVNQSSPTMDVTASMVVTMRLRSTAIHVHTRTVVQSIEAAERESWESFTVQSDETGASQSETGASLREGAALLDRGVSLPDRASLRSQEGEVFTVEQAVFHILRRFLHLKAIAH
jgi:hypothetical protein